MLSRELIAYNTATESSNKIHDDEVARKFGFAGGLVPGVEVHGYLSWGPVNHWGERWLHEGAMTSRYTRPTYDGATVSVTFDESNGSSAAGSNGAIDATAESSIPTEPPLAPTLADYPFVAVPDERPTASPTSLATGTELGSVEIAFPDVKAQSYLDDVREVLPLYAEGGFAHPGWVLGMANELLMTNVVLGPWIHVGSTVQNYSVIRKGQFVRCRGRVDKQYEKSGHRFVELDIAVFADDQPAARIAHTAIYEPRQVREVVGETPS